MILQQKHSSAASLVLIILFLLVPLSASAVDIYWDNSEVLVPDNGRFHRAAFGGGRTVVIWHEFIEQSPDRGIVYLSLASSGDGKEWLRNERFAGPFNYNGDEVPICSLAVKNDGRIYVSVSADENTIKIYSSGDNGTTFNEITRKTSFTMTVGPRLFIKEDGTFIMFVTRESGNNLSIFYAGSDTGEEWSDFTQLVSEPGLELNFLPQFVSRGGVEYVIFQSFLVQRRSTYQLYLKKSTDGGKSWGQAKRITDFDETAGGRTVESANFDNQRPDFKIDDSTIHLAWERRNISEANPQIYYAKLDLDGAAKEVPEKVSADGRSCNFPKIANYKGNIVITWFDNRMGDFHVIISDFNGILWRDRDLSLMEGDSIFGQPVEANGSLYILWENIRNNRSRIVLLSPDISVESPRASPVNFLSSRRSSRDRYSFSWNLPDDASGIAGFSYSTGRSRFGSPPRKIINTSRQLEGEVEIKEDGQWYIYLSAADYAGNWSETSVIPVYRDTVPPGPVTLDELEKDEKGFVKSNTLKVSWQPPDDEPIEGFVYNLQLIDENYRRDTEESVLLKKVKPPDKERRNPYPYLAYSNLDNGIWGLSVSAVDEAGNISEPVSSVFKLNKYIPVTIISSIDPVVDQLNRITINIKGRGFTAGGSISAIHLDRDGQAPWDYSFYLADNSYKIVNDKTITDFTVSDILEGVYTIALDHPRRGLYVTKPVIKLEPSGTVKLGYFVSGRETVWKPVRKKLFTFNAGIAGIYLILVICVLAIAVSAFRLRAVWAEGKMLKKDIDSIMKGIPLSYRERKERITVMKKKGM
ncbi:MAG: sialidase family protein, partial [Spirochaetia bacterium]|nr:sialidase family protein [Spirochaetia bacterium]